MKRSGPLRRGKPLRAVGKRGRQRRAAWDRVKVVVKKRSGGRCEACAFHYLPECPGRHQHTHHLRPKGVGGKDTVDNALGMSFVHHDWAHRHPDAARRLGLLHGPPEPPRAAP